MSYNPRFNYNDAIVRGLMRIEAARAVVDVLPVPLDVGLRLRVEARVRSTHHSTRIEGNRMKESAVTGAVLNSMTRRAPDEVEVRNYWRALEWIELQCENPDLRIGESTFRALHAIILPPEKPGRPPKRSVYRTTEIGVIDARTRDYEYQAPEPAHVPALMAGLAAWLASSAAASLPGPVRAAILAYQFVTVHPFVDGNGRTTRALATMELWRSGYGMRGFLSVEEHYTRDLGRYYAMLQMGLPANYHEGRHDPDLTPWIGYFVETLAAAADDVRRRATELYRAGHGAEPSPGEVLGRLQQQLLWRGFERALVSRSPPSFRSTDVAAWFGVHEKTAAEWLQGWRGEDFVAPASGDKRITAWKFSQFWETIIMKACANLLNKESDKEGV